ncbi:ATP-dependent DNA helicase [Sporosarcina globispora]|uniref:ATP-dependent DNA helicase n=1 Tax=Sporosarcina globispora TaxID=1459 RepID=A0A0M0GBX2_SPOGL|nr:ATP-dependent DNA helicase [Sporosarcina globispora]KON87263.1 ATP-dependent DNA helicase [Sporosarcina globispora]
MNVLFAFMLLFTNWYYIPKDSPAVPVKVESINLKLKSDELAFTFFSLSDGEASLIHHGNEEKVLINTGGPGTEEELKKLLELYGVNQISAIILTDKELYNMSSLKWLIDDFGVKEVIAGDSAVSELKDENSISKLNLHAWNQDFKQDLFPGLQTEVLFAGNGPGEGTDISFTFARHRILFMNSTSPQAKASLMEKDLSNVNIVKLPAFGRNDSISEEMIKHLDPQIAILFYNPGIKPGSDLFGLLNDAWVDVYYTRKHGTVTIKFTDINYELFTIFQGEEFK